MTTIFFYGNNKFLPENASKTLEGQIIIIYGDHIYRRLVHGAATRTT